MKSIETGSWTYFSTPSTGGKPVCVFQHGIRAHVVIGHLETAYLHRRTGKSLPWMQHYDSPPYQVPLACTSALPAPLLIATAPKQSRLITKARVSSSKSIFCIVTLGRFPLCLVSSFVSRR